MSFNILGAIVHGAESFLMSGGNPVAAGIGAVEGGQRLAGMSDALDQQPDILADVNQLSNLFKGVE